MPDTRDAETAAPGSRGRRPRLAWRLLRGAGWLAFYLVVAAVSYIVCGLGGR